jgi:serine/threonine-protein kinase RsbW
MATVVEVEVPGQIEVIDDLEDSVVRLGQRNGLDPDASYFLGVALREALLNAILHGRALAHGRPVQVRIAIGEGWLSVTVRDFGPGFEPETVPDPVAPENCFRGCGRGIFFMRRFADEVVFHRPQDGGQSVELRKQLPPG